ncbi:hypothetical protein BFR57_02790 [Idiomarina sp. MD25a]|uniref:putative bifunctional diguanylate cyclase/phosphodiesterase n=1 Tax=Idiomarina sp. MD25a TaxID=1889913 RepID=UPI0008F8B9EA|nr:EAL domain-containing protein [Idiomarina sp. MD25a]OIM99512.1 hypothetical protein BFR57_02790 [Idiomarina sp. MD25a]
MEYTCARYEIFDKSRIATVMVDRDCAITYANQGAKLLLGDHAHLGQHLALQLPSDEKEFLSSSFQVDEHSGQPVYYCAISVTDDECQQYLIYLHPFNMHLSESEHLPFLSQHDPLTGLPNRTQFIKRLQRHCLSESCEKTLTAVIFLDLDGFKAINDSLGHEMGDKLLQVVAGRIRNQLRNSDTLTRLSGDEFLMILTGLEARQDAAIVTQRILDDIARPYKIESTDIYITASAGVTYCKERMNRAEVMIQQADIAMFEAKRAGKNTFQWFDKSFNDELNRALMIRNSVQKGIDKEQFHLVYQPQICLASNTVCGLEALIRWRHPDIANLSPAEFIPILESSGQVIPLSYWIMRQAFRDWKQLKPLLTEGARMSVNVSTVHITRSDFIEQLEKVIIDTEITPSEIKLEITESMMLRNAQTAVATLDKLTDMGVAIALDDFGTGFSNLRYLTQMPISDVKLDRSFIRGIDANNANQVIVRGIIGMAHELGLNTVAEGVETVAEKAMVQHLETDVMQGFLEATPMRFAPLVEFLTRR